MKRNRIEWAPGDVVLHYQDPHTEEYLAMVLGYNLDEQCVVEYLATKERRADSLGMFLDPLNFGIKAKRIKDYKNIVEE